MSHRATSLLSLAALAMAIAFVVLTWRGSSDSQFHSMWDGRLWSEDVWNPDLNDFLAAHGPTHGFWLLWQWLASIGGIWLAVRKRHLATPLALVIGIAALVLTALSTVLGIPFGMG